MLDSAIDRYGIDREGVTGFIYAEDADEGEVPPGKVHVYFMDENLVLDRPFFDAAVVEYGLAALAALRAAGRHADEETMSRLKALQARVREFGDGRTVVLKRRVGDIEMAVEVARDGWTNLRRADGKSWAPGTAMIRLWRDSQEDFIQMLETGKGWEREWGYRFAYTDGEVEVYVPEIKTLYKRAEFEALASEFGLAALEGARLLGRSVPDGLEARLRAVRARI